MGGGVVLLLMSVRSLMHDGFVPELLLVCFGGWRTMAVLLGFGVFL